MQLSDCEQQIVSMLSATNGWTITHGHAYQNHRPIVGGYNTCNEDVHEYEKPNLNNHHNTTTNTTKAESSCMATTTATTPRPPAIMDHHHQKPIITTRRSQDQNQQIQQQLKCPRCDSSNTKFCYYNNYSLSQPRHFCKACKRYWTRGGTLRNVPVGGGCRKNHRRAAKRLPPPTSPSSIILSSSSAANYKQQLVASSATCTGDHHSTSTATTTNNNNPITPSSLSISSSVGALTLNNPLLYAPPNAELMINNNFPFSSSYNYDDNPNSSTTSRLGLMGFLTGRSDLTAGNYKNACNFPSTTFSKQTIQDLISPIRSTTSFPNSSPLSAFGSNPSCASTSTNTTATTLTSSTATVNNIITNCNLQSSQASTTQQPQFNFNQTIFPLEDLQQLKEGINQCGGTGHKEHDDGHMKMEDLTTNFHHQYGNTMSMTSHHHLVTSSSSTSSDPPILWNINNNTTNSISTTAAGTTTTTSTTAHDQFVGANWLSVDPYNNYSSMGSSSTSSLLPSFI